MQALIINTGNRTYVHGDAIAIVAEIVIAK